jgi:hypothetical protein
MSHNYVAISDETIEDDKFCDDEFEECVWVPWG